MDCCFVHNRIFARVSVCACMWVFVLVLVLVFACKYENDNGEESNKNDRQGMPHNVAAAMDPRGNVGSADGTNVQKT